MRNSSPEQPDGLDEFLANAMAEAERGGGLAQIVYDALLKLCRSRITPRRSEINKVVPGIPNGSLSSTLNGLVSSGRVVVRGKRPFSIYIPAELLPKGRKCG